ncbi:MAG: hypothetical protein WCO94_11785, partial [Verrucomicrobiota bacterium]
MGKQINRPFAIGLEPMLRRTSFDRFAVASGSICVHSSRVSFKHMADYDLIVVGGGPAGYVG